MADIATRFATAYKDFGEKASAAYAVGPKRGNPESAPAFHLRIASWYLSHKRTGSAEDKAFDDARRAGRNCMKLLTENIEEVKKSERSFISHGYAELTNVYVFCAPLDALNWRVMKAPQYDDVTFANWNEVVLMNVEAEDIHVSFLSHHRDVMNRVASGEIKGDPFDTSSMTAVLSDIGTAALPASLTKDQGSAL
jgi:hypothetical protein